MLPENPEMRIEFSFQVNSQLISNVCTDALSAEKVTDLVPLFCFLVNKLVLSI